MNALAADVAPPTSPAFSADVAEPANSAVSSQQARFAALYREHADRVFRLCLRLCGGHHAEAEDLAQDALIAAFRSLPRFAGRARVTTWLYAVTLRTYQKQRRRAWGKPETLALQEGDGSRANFLHGAANANEPASDAADQHLTRLTIDAAISELANPLREAFVLVKVEGLTHREAAALLGLPQGTVQARVHEAARRLRAALQDTFQD